MLRGARRYTLAADNSGKKNIRMNAAFSSFGQSSGGVSGAAPATLSGTTVGQMTSSGNSRKNWERYERDLLEGFVQYDTDTSVRKIQNDMFYFDPIVGSVVEIRSKIPFSNFELSGTSSKERRQKYTDSVNAMQIRGMLEKISREKMVEGKHISYMNFDNTDKKFTSIIPINPEYAAITPIPVYGRDPLVDVKYPDHILNSIKSDDPDMKAELERYAEDLVEMVTNKQTRLNPKFTLYLARTPFTWSPYGISLLRRLIPVWLFEKALMRGTIDMSGRRQKAIQHIIMGDDEWLPTNEQLKKMTDLFIDADNDPLGAMVATRPNVSVESVNAGSEIWKWTDESENINNAKMRGLGVPDSIFGDFSVQAAESTISSFLEDMNNEREECTQRVFYNKMFLIIADENDFKLEDTKTLTSSDKLNRTLLQRYREDHDYVSRHSQHVLLSADESIDPALYDMPTLRWEKSLKIVSNDALFNNLGTLAERGMPTPLRMQAALLGMSAEDMFKGLEQDVEDRKIIDEYAKRLPKPPAAEGEGGEDGGSNMFMESSDKFKQLLGSNHFAKTQPKPNRSFEHFEVKDPLTGKHLSRKGKQHKNDRENKIIQEAADRLRARTGKEPPVPNRKSYSYKGQK